MSLISIIVPCYNGARYLPATLRSILGQRSSAFELLLIDDGSTDETATIAADFQAADSRIAYFKRRNAGVSAARNFGFRQASGEYIVFFDADDIMEPGFLADRKFCLDRNPGVGLCGSTIRYIDQDGVALAQNGQPHAPDGDPLPPILLYHPDVVSCPSNYMFRRTVLERLPGPFDERLSSTADKFLLCALSPAVCRNLSASTLSYRLSAGSMSNKMTEHLLADNLLYFRLCSTELKIPPALTRQFLSKNYRILAGMNRKLGKYFSALRFGIGYLFATFRRS